MDICTYSDRSTICTNHYVSSYVACNVSNAKNYSSGCQVSSCNAGWSVDADKAKCVANVCFCTNGIALSGEQCLSNGLQRCASCNSGFKLREDQTACDGTILHRYHNCVVYYICHSEFDPGQLTLVFVVHKTDT